MSFVKFVCKLRDCLFVWRVPTASTKQIQEAQAILTMAHGRMRDNSPGPGNIIMTGVVRALHRQYSMLPILPQEEISMTAPDLTYHAVASGSPDGCSSMGWNTRKIAEIQVAACKKNGWAVVIAVVFPIHMGRAKWVYEKLGMKVHLVPMPMDLKKYMHPDLVPGGILGIQTVPRFYVREVLCRLLFLWKGWI